MTSYVPSQRRTSKEIRHDCDYWHYRDTAREGINARNPDRIIGSIDPVASGLVKSMARAEANVTGVTSRADVEMPGKRLETFKQVVPSVKRVTVIYNARGENPGHIKSLAMVQKIAPELELQLAENPIKSTADLAGTFLIV